MYNMNTPENVIMRKMSVYWLTLLLLNGTDVYPNQAFKGTVKRIAAVYPWLICIFWTFIMTSVMTLLVTQDTSYEETIEMLTYITGSSSTLIMFIIGVHKRSEFNHILNIVVHNFWYDKRVFSADISFSKFIHTYGIIMPVANLMMCMTPIFWAANYGNINSPAAFIFIMWTPWTQLTTAKYVVLYSIQFIVSISVLTSIVGMVNAMVLIVDEMQVQIDILNHVIIDLDVTSPHKSMNALNILVKCIKHHQTLVRYFNHFKSYFNLLFIVDVVYIMIMTCLCASCVLLANGFSAFHTKMMSLLIIVISQFFFYCLIGEKFSSMNKKLGDCIYFKLAKCKNTQLLKIGHLIILRTQKPLQLNTIGISKYTASLSTFSVVMKSTYTGLNLLYNSSKNTN